MMRVFAPPVLYFAKLIIGAQTEAVQEEGGREKPVEAITLKKSKIRQRIDSIALVRSDNFVDIKTQKQNMRIQEILYTEGEFVEKDQPLIQFDDTETKSKYEEAKAKSLFAQADFKRTRYLFEKNAASKNDMQEKEGEYLKAKGQLEEAEAALKNTLIRAPISGVAGVLDGITVGSIASPDKTLLSISNDRKTVNISFKVPLRYLNDLKLGQKTLFKVEAFDDEFEGTVIAIDSRAYEGDILVRANINNKNNVLKSGMLGTVQIITDNEEIGFKVPKTSVVKKAENHYTPTVEKNKIVNKLVVKGPDIDNDTVILSGLSEDDIIVLNTNADFIDGAGVMITKLDGVALTEGHAIEKAQSYSMKNIFLTEKVKLLARYILERSSTQQEKVPINVYAQSVKTRTVQRKLSAIGLIRSENFVELKSHIQNYRIQKIHFKEGEWVEEDTTLIEFDSAEARGGLKKSKGHFEAKKAVFERMKKVFEQKAIPQIEFDKIKAEYEMAEAELKAAQYRLDNMKIKAPFSGKIGILQKVNVGSLPPGDKPIVSIVNDKSVFLYTHVPIKYLNRVGLGQGIQASFESFPNKIFEGTIVSIDSKVDDKTQTILLKVQLKNENELLKSGSLGYVDLIIDTIENAIVVPESACLGLSRARDIMVGIKNGKTVRYVIDKDFNFSEGNQVFWVVKKGLRKGDVYVAEVGTNTMRFGYPVVIANPETNPLMDEAKEMAPKDPSPTAQDDGEKEPQDDGEKEPQDDGEKKSQDDSAQRHHELSEGQCGDPSKNTEKMATASMKPRHDDSHKSSFRKSIEDWLAGIQKAFVRLKDSLWISGSKSPTSPRDNDVKRHHEEPSDAVIHAKQNNVDGHSPSDPATTNVTNDKTGEQS